MNLMNRLEFILVFLSNFLNILIFRQLFLFIIKLNNRENASYLTVTINARTTVLESIKIASEKFDINVLLKFFNLKVIFKI